MKRLLCLNIFIFSFLFKELNAQSGKDAYRQRVDVINHNIYKYFYDSTSNLYYETNDVHPGEKKHSYLWPLCALIQAADEAELVNDDKDYLTPVLKAIDQYYNDILLLLLTRLMY